MVYEQTLFVREARNRICEKSSHRNDDETLLNCECNDFALSATSLVCVVAKIAQVGNSCQ